MKQYLAFGGSVYYPSGGAADYLGAFDTLDEAMARGRQFAVDDGGIWWWNVLDVSTGEIAASEHLECRSRDEVVHTNTTRRRPLR